MTHAKLKVNVSLLKYLGIETNSFESDTFVTICASKPRMITEKLSTISQPGFVLLLRKTYGPIRPAIYKP